MAVVRWKKQQWFEWDIPLNRMQEGKVYSGNDINAMNSKQGRSVVLT